MSVEGEDSAGTADLAASLIELSALLLSTEDVEEALRHLARMAVQVIPDGPSCGITVVRDGHPATVVYTGPLPRTVDEAQYARDDGPCLQAIRTRSPVTSQDLAVEHRWGDYPAVALAAGARGIYAHPLVVDGRAVGALNLYALEPDLFPERVRQVATHFADHAGVLLAAVFRHASQVELTGQLQTALSSRAVIDQAIGIIMAERRCGQDEAFDILRKASNDRNVKLRDVAQRLVASMREHRRPRLPRGRPDAARHARHAG